MNNDSGNILEKIGNKIPFDVPEGYFEDFATRFENQISEQPKSSKKMFVPWLYMAAMFVGIFLIGNVIYYINFDKSVEPNEISKTNDTNDLYEIYLTSQVDQSITYDYYVANYANDFE
ncbi:hypothetical protein MASR2M117_05560 [Paludibacter sp.]